MHSFPKPVFVHKKLPSSDSINLVRANSSGTSSEVPFRPPPAHGGLELIARWIQARSQALLSSDRGMATAEYAIGTIAAASFGGILFKLLTSNVVQQLLMELLRRAFSFLL